MTIEKIFENGDPQDIVAAMRLHPKYQTDRQYRRSVNMFTSQTNGLIRQRIEGTLRQDDLDLKQRQLLGRMDEALSFYRIYDTELPERRAADNLLFLAANPGDILQMQREFSEVFAHLQDKDDRYQLRYSEKTTRQNVRQVLLGRKPNIVHFSGHGVGADNGFQPAGLVFEHPDNRAQADVMPAAEARDMFALIHQNAPLKLVLLNACESAEHARLISEIGCYTVGMTERIKDTDAVRFAEGFYLGLAGAADRDDPVPFAFAAGVDHLPEGVRGVAKLFQDGVAVDR